MNDLIDAMDAALAKVRAAWAESGEQMDASRDARGQIDAMTDAGLMAVNEALAAARRRLDALHAPVAAEIAGRSAASRGSEGFARKNGHRTPVKLIATTTGGHAGDAAKLIQVGEATSGRMTFSGERTTPKRPHVAAGLSAGTLSVAAAAAITAMLDKLDVRVDAAVLADAEESLVAQATMLSLDELNAVLRRAEAELDPEGLAEHVEKLRAERSLRVREDRYGRIVLSGVWGPEGGAPVKTVIEALVTNELRTSRGSNRVDAEGDALWDGSAAGVRCLCEEFHVEGCEALTGPDAEPAMAETRSIPQMNADALTAICRHALACDETDLPLAATTVVVRIPVEALTSGEGVATIDGVAQPIDAGTARRMAANGNVIPCVLGADSEVLDWGRGKRFFTPAQRLALVERDGGCASCGLPPGMTEAHHLLWWDLHQGPTDLQNGILLCTRCHHLVHNEGWEVRIDPPPGGDMTGGTVWFVPPAHVDPQRRPRLGGRKRFDFLRKRDLAVAA